MLLNRHNQTDPGFLDELPELSTTWEIDGVPSIEEARSAINGLKNNTQQVQMASRLSY